MNNHTEQTEKTEQTEQIEQTKQTKQTKQRMKFCLMTNAMLVSLIALFVSMYSTTDDPYMRYGPQADLKLLGVAIDTWPRYWIFQLFLGCIEVTDVIIQDLANPIFAFNIYNPDKKIIIEYTKNELQLYAQSFMFLSQMKGALMLMVTITQLDIAISKCVFSTLASIFATRILLNDKKFIAGGAAENPDELTEAMLVKVSK